MVTASLYRQLVPAAPLHRRTDRDTYPSPEAELRARLAARLRPPDARPRLRAPTLVSSWQGTIDGLLMAFPSWGVADPALAAAYRSVITSMPTGTEFVVVHHRAQRASVEGWFAEAGHPAENVIYVPLADYVNFTDWAEDAYASVLDGVDGSLCLMEPWEFPRGGDALIAEAVQDHTGVRAGQAPLIFQGGNCLVGDRFWLLGKDYFADSLALVDGERPPVLAPPSTAPGDFVTSLYADYLDAGRELVVVGTDRPIAPWPARPRAPAGGSGCSSAARRPPTGRSGRSHRSPSTTSTTRSPPASRGWGWRSCATRSSTGPSWVPRSPWPN
jgi:hypothetical protein